MSVNDCFDKLWDFPPEGAAPREVRALISGLVLSCGQEQPDMPAIIQRLESLRALDYFQQEGRVFHREIGKVACRTCAGWDEPYLYEWARDTLAAALRQMYPDEVIRLPAG